MQEHKSFMIKDILSDVLSVSNNNRDGKCANVILNFNLMSLFRLTVTDASVIL